MTLHMLFPPGITHPRYRTSKWKAVHDDLRWQKSLDDIARDQSKIQRKRFRSVKFKATGARS